ncbi:MAG TPA: YcxB family protein [Pyrinomonadaceae bacterium]|nr:YcxB family protein [Pyrinomonadaceae bacterium]
MENPISDEHSIVIDARIKLNDYKVYWFDYFKKSLPNAVVFWGIFALGSLFFAYILRENAVGFWFFVIASFFLIFIPALMYAVNYREFMRTVNRYISGLSDAERNFSMIFKPNSDGFDLVNGKNFSHISWSSVKSVSEKDNYFIMDFRSQPFILSKSGIKNESDLNELRLILSSNLGSKVKFLNQ